ncbi:MAG: FtsW/RodA/SpoVE family cell cycle protein [Elusimicrobiaceae bacterium]|nr:FtsW/RodA/SpoVE family cell cycle protein [Elusimicrobiaceae bacterium]
MMNYKSNLRKSKMDWLLLGAMAGLAVMGALCIMSAVNALSLSNAVVRTHLIALPIGLTAFLAAWSFNYQIFDEQWKPLYGVIMALLVGVLIFGTYQRGSKSWFVLPFFSMQPAELCRVLTILVAAAFLDRQGRRIRDVRTLVLLGVLVGPIFGLIMMQPDFSSIVITFPALVVLLFCAGINVFFLAWWRCLPRWRDFLPLRGPIYIYTLLCKNILCLRFFTT